MSAPFYDPHAHTTRFRLLRLLALATVVITVGLYIFTLPIFIEHARTLCVSSPCSFPQLDGAGVAALAAAGLSLNTYMAYIVSIRLVFVILFLSISVLLLLNKSDDGFAWFLAVALVTFACGTFSDELDLLPQSYPLLFFPVHLIEFSGDVLIFIFLYIFPNGRFVPRWMVVFVFAAAFFDLWKYFFPTSPLNVDNWPTVFSSIEFFGLLIGGLYAQIYRYRRVSTPRERQQTKWVVFATCIGLGGFVTVIFVVTIFPVLDQDIVANILSYLAIHVFIALLPISIGIAILRSHLWDIDILIRKTLTYTIVALLLAVVYFGSVILLQQIVAQLTGQRNEIATVLSTLAIAALFVPLRNRIQDWIDRRFYRRKYNAQQVLNDFAQTVRDETDLENLCARLMQVVDTTMQPKSLSIWLRGTLIQSSREHKNETF